MLSLSSLIEFLLDMMRDPTTQNAYARDPNATLAARGLSGVTAQDVQDVQPLLADHQGVSLSTGGAHAARSAVLDHSYGHPAAHGGHHAGHDPSAAIHRITNAYEVDHSTVVRNVTQEYKQYATYKTYVTDNSVHADHGSTVIQDSFNQDNDGIDLKGATVDHSGVAGHDADRSGNTVDSTTNQGSHNDDHSTVDSHDVDTSHDYADVGNDSGKHHTQDPHDDPSHSSGDTYAPDHAASVAVDDGGDALGAHHA